MQVKVKKLSENAVVPMYGKPGDAGQDLVCVSRHFDADGNAVYGTGLAFEIPEGYVGLIFPRSSNAKKDLMLTNSVGVVDSGYRGEVMFKFKPVAFLQVQIVQSVVILCRLILPSFQEVSLLTLKSLVLTYMKLAIG